LAMTVIMVTSSRAFKLHAKNAADRQEYPFPRI
jgi:hypothetical protein